LLIKAISRGGEEDDVDIKIKAISRSREENDADIKIKDPQAFKLID
jgi:hypothetical protein